MPPARFQLIKQHQLYRYDVIGLPVHCVDVLAYPACCVCVSSGILHNGLFGGKNRARVLPTVCTCTVGVVEKFLLTKKLAP